MATPIIILQTIHLVSCGVFQVFSRTGMHQTTLRPPYSNGLKDCASSTEWAGEHPEAWRTGI